MPSVSPLEDRVWGGVDAGGANGSVSAVSAVAALAAIEMGGIAGPTGAAGAAVSTVAGGPARRSLAQLGIRRRRRCRRR
ncbi:hypothetical protein OSJ18_25620, partial [Mycobacterium ulcerans]